MVDVVTVNTVEIVTLPERVVEVVTVAQQGPAGPPGIDGYSDSFSILLEIPNVEYAALAAGTSTYDCTDALLASIAKGRVSLPDGVYPIKTAVNITTDCDIVGSKNAVLDVSQSGGFQFSGGWSTLPGLSANILAGDTTVQFESAHGLGVGDWFIVHDITDFSFSPARSYYTKGTWFKVKRVVSTTIVSVNESEFDFTAGAQIVVSKYTSTSKIKLEGFTVRSINPALLSTVKLVGLIGPELKNITIEGYSYYAALEIDRCINALVEPNRIIQDYFEVIGNTTAGSPIVTNASILNNSSVSLADIPAGSTYDFFNDQSVFPEYAHKVSSTSNTLTLNSNATDTRTGVIFTVARGLNYGVLISNSYGTDIRSNGKGLIYAARHAVTVGGASNDQSACSMYTTIDNVILESPLVSSDGGADTHGNAYDTAYKNCEIWSGCAFGGQNITLQDCNVSANRYGMCISISEYRGGVLAVKGNSFEAGAINPELVSRGIIEIGRNGGGIDANTLVTPEINVTGNAIVLNYTGYVSGITLYNRGFAGEVRAILKDLTVSYGDGITPSAIDTCRGNDTGDYTTGGYIRVSGMVAPILSNAFYHTNPTSAFEPLLNVVLDNPVTTSDYVSLYATENIGGHRVVVAGNTGGAIADTTNTSHVGAVVGITKSAYSLGDYAQVYYRGEIQDAVFNFTVGPVYFNSSGVLTNTLPTSGFIQQVATAIATDKILIDIQEPLVL